jgi:phage-related protein
VRQFFGTLSDAELEQVAAAMKTVANLGVAEARHLRGEIDEVRATRDNRAFRVLFANEGRQNQILLALEGFEKKTQKTPARTVDLAETRLANWRTGELAGTGSSEIYFLISHIRYVTVKAWPASNHSMSST